MFKLISRIQKYKNIQLSNIEFIKSRLTIQAAPNYNSFAKSGGQWGECQYNSIEIELIKNKVLKADIFLRKMKILQLK